MLKKTKNGPMGTAIYLSIMMAPNGLSHSGMKMPSVTKQLF